MQSPRQAATWRQAGPQSAGLAMLGSKYNCNLNLIMLGLSKNLGQLPSCTGCSTTPAGI